VIKLSLSLSLIDRALKIVLLIMMMRNKETSKVIERELISDVFSNGTEPAVWIIGVFRAEREIEQDTSFRALIF
jgi:hypothetical protein